LITLISGALVGSLIYLGVVVRKLRRTVNNNVLDIKNLESALNEIERNTHSRIDGVNDDLDKRLNDLDNTLSNAYSEIDRKIDSRYDKLYDGYNKENQQIYQELQKRDESIEHVRDLTRQALGLKK
jgi:glycerol-3-phosphate O-acyltransferase